MKSDIEYVPGGDKMTLDVIKEVRKAEQDAENIIVGSISSSRDIISNAEKEKNKILENALKEGEMVAVKTMKDMENDAQEKLKKYI